MGVFKVLLQIATIPLGPVGPVTIDALDRARKDYKKRKLQKTIKALAQAREEGRKATEAILKKKYEERINGLLKRFKNYQDFENKLIGMYAIGLAIANADGYISKEEVNELDDFVSGCLASKLPSDIKKQISNLAKEPPIIDDAVECAKKYGVPKKDIDDLIWLIANADNTKNAHEDEFIRRWESMSSRYITS